MDILIVGDYYLPKWSRNNKESDEKPKIDSEILEIINSADYLIDNSNLKINTLV